MGVPLRGPGLAALAKTLFAEYAAKNSRSIWKKDALKTLEGGAS